MTRNMEDFLSTRATGAAVTESVVSRRAFFTAGLGGASLLGPVAPAAAQDVAPGGNPFALRPFDKLYTLVNRVTQGFTQRDYRHAKQLGYDAYLEEQLDYLSIDDTAMDNRLAQFTTLGMTNAELYTNYPPDGPNLYQPAGELIEANLLRSIFSKRQLHQRMTEFWTDHLNTFILDGPLIYFKTVEDREVIRQHAHAGLGLAVQVVRGAQLDRGVAKRAVSPVDPELVGVGIVGHVDVHPAVVVEVLAHHPEPGAGDGGDARRLTDVGEGGQGGIAIVAQQDVGLEEHSSRLVEVDRSKVVSVLHGRHRDAGRRQRFPPGPLLFVVPSPKGHVMHASLPHAPLFAGARGQEIDHRAHLVFTRTEPEASPLLADVLVSQKVREKAGRGVRIGHIE